VKLRLVAFVAVLVSACTPFSQHLRDGDTLAAAKHWGEAEREYKDAAEDEPNRPEPTDRIRALHDAWAAELTATAEERRAAGDLDGATHSLLRAQQVVPAYPPARRAMAKVLETKAAKAAQLIDSGHSEEALAAFDAILHLQPNESHALAGRTRAKATIADRAFQAGQAFEKKGRPGNALVEYVKADAARPGATAAHERAEALRRSLLSELSFSIVPLPVQDRSKSPDIAVRLTGPRLAAMLPPGLPVKVEEAAPSSHRGVKVSITLDDVQYDYAKDIVPRTAPPPPASEVIREAEGAVAAEGRRVIAGDEQLEHARQDLDRCWAEVLIDCRKALERCGGHDEGACRGSACDAARCSTRVAAVAKSGEDAGALRRRLEASVAAVEAKPGSNSEGFTYDVEVHHATVIGSVTFALSDLDGAATPVTEDFAASDQDETHPAHPEHGIPADALQIKNEATLRRELSDQILAAALDRIHSRYEAYRLALADVARRQFGKSDDSEEAVEAAVRALLVAPDAQPSDLLAMVAKARQIDVPETIAAAR
jgi:hypothetical protein